MYLRAYAYISFNCIDIHRHLYMFVFQSLPVQLGHVYQRRSNDSVLAWIQSGHG